MYFLSVILIASVLRTSKKLLSSSDFRIMYICWYIKKMIEHITDNIEISSVDSDIEDSEEPISNSENSDNQVQNVSNYSSLYITKKFIKKKLRERYQNIIEEEKKKKDCGRSQNFTEEDKDKKRQKQRPFVYQKYCRQFFTSILKYFIFRLKRQEMSQRYIFVYQCCIKLFLYICLKKLEIWHKTLYGLFGKQIH